MRVKRKKKYGGVEGYGSFPPGDRACCHGAGPLIGGSFTQSCNSADCFIIEKFFLSSCLVFFTPGSSTFFFSFLPISLAPSCVIILINEIEKISQD